MQIRHKYESDGKCVSKIAGGCLAMGGKCAKDCGTYRCVFYKPEGCQDWYRDETPSGLVRLFPPEEVSYGQEDK